MGRYFEQSLRFLGIAWVCIQIVGCVGPLILEGPVTLRYVGSSTVGQFMDDAREAYREADFIMDTEPESYGGQAAILSGTADIGGVAGEVARDVLNQGVVATQIGRDAIAVIVNRKNPLSDLSSANLKGIFTGSIKNWKELGGPDVPIRPLIVGPASATRAVFKEQILEDLDYNGCEVIEPDGRIMDRIGELEGAVGQISFSFLGDRTDVKPVSIDGQELAVTNFNYPITRPLFLLTKGRPKSDTKSFIDWVLSQEGQRVILKRFVGVHVLTYAGSSTVGRFITDAQKVYGRSSFLMDTGPESRGALQAVLTNAADIGGVAGPVDPAIESRGIAATMIGKDAIAVIVNRANPVRDLSANQLRAIFTGRIRNWREVGGPDLSIEPLIVGPASATREIFREQILREQEYSGCQVVKPDKKIVDKVRRSEGAIGQISFAFLKGRTDVKAIHVEGQDPTVTNFSYPIFRALYLLTRKEPKDEVRRFTDWALSRNGQSVLMERFVGANTLGSVTARPVSRPKLGYLIVYTETYEYEDSDTYYYPHLSYDILDLHGNLVRRVRNRIGDTDERPSTVELSPGKYFIVAESNRRKRPEVLVTIARGRTTEVDIEALLQAR